MKKGILLFSGGLDSLLAYYLLKKANFIVKPVQFYTPFLHINDKKKYINKIKDNYYIELEVIDVSEKFLKILFHPEYGYGKNLNPCVDCKILFFKEAKKLMENLGYDFIATGEIPGQRPFSQQKNFMNLIEKKAEIRGYILRPLAISTSKLNFEIDKTKFLDISGRSRKIQLKLAKEFNIKHIPSPAGGCLLTDPNFCEKINILIECLGKENLRTWHFEVIKFGRVFKILDNFIAIIGRNRKENKILQKFSDKGIFVKTKKIPSPSLLVIPIGKINSEILNNEIYKILKKYTKKEYHPQLENIKFFYSYTEI